jgi:hypothetical protein
MEPTETNAARTEWTATDLKACGVLTLLWLVPLLIIGLNGEFTLNDDWAYSFATSGYLRTGHLIRSSWTFTPIISNVAIGVAFAKVFGFSLAVLRASTFVMGWLGMLGMYAWLRELGVARKMSGIAAATLGFNPLYLHLSYTYMTDVPFTAFVVWSLVATTWGLRRRRWLGYGIGLGFGILATLSRQPGAAVVAAIVVTLTLMYVPRWQTLVLRGGLMFGALALALVVERSTLGSGARGDGGVLELLRQSFAGGNNLYFIVRNGVQTVVYGGVFLLPLLVPLALPSMARTRWLGPATAATALGLLALIATKFTRLPLGINIIDPGGLGPITLHGTASNRVLLPTFIWWLFDLAGAVAGSFAVVVSMAWMWRRAWGERVTNAERLLPLCVLAIYLLPIVLRPIFFDRYLVAVLPCLLAIVIGALEVRSLARGPFAVACGVLACMSGYGVVGTRDYLEHHRCRTALLDPLVQQGVSPTEIEGGFEFDGQFRYPLLEAEAREARKAGSSSNTHISFKRSGGTEKATRPALGTFVVTKEAFTKERHCKWPEGTTYLLSYCPEVEGYRAIASRSFQRVLPWSTETLYLQRRNLGTAH